MSIKKDLLKLVKPQLVDEVVKLKTQLAQANGKITRRDDKLELLTIEKDDVVKHLAMVRHDVSILRNTVRAFNCQGFIGRLFKSDPEA